jgi:hypothetical protein
MVTKIFLRWTPRLLCIAFAAFLAIFALDVFEEHAGIVQTALALAMHLLPTAIVLAVLAVAWRRPVVGGAALVLLGFAYSAVVIQRHHPLSWVIAIAGPAFLVGALFIAEAAITKSRTPKSI